MLGGADPAGAQSTNSAKVSHFGVVNLRRKKKSEDLAKYCFAEGGIKADFVNPRRQVSVENEITAERSKRLYDAGKAPVEHLSCVVRIA
jgi:hypothetical protein